MRARTLVLGVVACLGAAGAAFAAPQDAIDQCFGNAPTIVGTSGNDVLRGTPGEDTIAGLEGDDTIVGGSGNDVLCGGVGDDVLRGGPGGDGIVLDRGEDRAFGEEGIDWLTELTESQFALVDAGPYDTSDDLLSGGPDLDFLEPEGGNDTVEGGGGFDIFVGWSSADPLIIDLQNGSATSHREGTDELNGIEGAYGGFGQDILVGDDSTNLLWGGLGGDRVNGAGGSDLLLSTMDGATLVGGDDQAPDTVVISMDEPAVIDLNGGSVTSMEFGDGHPSDTLVDIERAVGSSHADIITGSAFDDDLFGMEGDDFIHGGAGDDLLRGDGPATVAPYWKWRSYGGADQLEGGPGTDDLDGGPQDDRCTGGETVRSCESEQMASSSSRVSTSSTWLFPGPQPWWWSSIDRFALHPN